MWSIGGVGEPPGEPGGPLGVAGELPGARFGAAPLMAVAGWWAAG